MEQGVGLKAGQQLDDIIIDPDEELDVDSEAFNSEETDTQQEPLALLIQLHILAADIGEPSRPTKGGIHNVIFHAQLTNGDTFVKGSEEALKSLGTSLQLTTNPDSDELTLIELLPVMTNSGPASPARSHKVLATNRDNPTISQKIHSTIKTKLMGNNLVKSCQKKLNFDQNPVNDNRPATTAASPMDSQQTTTDPDKTVAPAVMAADSKPNQLSAEGRLADNIGVPTFEKSKQTKPNGIAPTLSPPPSLTPTTIPAPEPTSTTSHPPSTTPTPAGPTNTPALEPTTTLPHPPSTTPTPAGPTNPPTHYYHHPNPNGTHQLPNQPTLYYPHPNSSKSCQSLNHPAGKPNPPNHPPGYP
ncbi:mucin-2-like [Gigantopelta aegis]|uniref:mucin-2-like n=1 Tax=Gigantopelta aegis TaxID=1735272 RepID=UPI001B88CED0|nr:mucin-2-like [Gigantopelta aegis]